MSRFDDLIGNPAAEPPVAEGLVRRVVGRIQPLADRGALPTGGIYGDIARVQDGAAERVELVRRIGEALAAGDNGRAQRLIAIAGIFMAMPACRPWCRRRPERAGSAP